MRQHPVRPFVRLAVVLSGLGASLVVAALRAGANPLDGTITFGDVTIEDSPGITTITQTTDRGAITWESFDIDTGERVIFEQPGTNSITLNTVRTPAPSTIQGQIDAPGQVWISNPSGVLIGPEATIDVGGFLATTATIATEDFAAERDVFRNGPGQVINRGEIVAREGGVVLVAPDVENSGDITVIGGDIQLHAGTAFTIDMEGDGLLGYTVDADTEIARQLANTGTLRTEGGSVYLTATAADEVVNSVIIANGVVEATRVELDGGEIVLSGAGETHVTGALTATSPETGGRIEVTAPAIAIESTARIDVSAPGGDGTIRIGDKHGIRPAEVVIVHEGAELIADAIEFGTGGKIEIWSETATWFFGTASSRANLAGDGGFIEISSAGHLDYDGTVFLDAARGRDGTLLFDPDYIFVVAAGADDTQVLPDLRIDAMDLGGLRTIATTPFANAMTISATTLGSLGGNVVLQANQDIHIGADLSLGTQNLTLQAGGRIEIDANIFIADGNLRIDGLGTDLPDLVRFGDVTTPAAANTLGINLTTGDLIIRADGDVELHGDLVLGGRFDAVTTAGSIFIDSAAGLDALSFNLQARASSVVLATYTPGVVGHVSAEGGDIRIVANHTLLSGSIRAAGEINIPGGVGSSTLSIGGVLASSVPAQFHVTPSTLTGTTTPVFPATSLVADADVFLQSGALFDVLARVESRQGDVTVWGSFQSLSGTLRIQSDLTASGDITIRTSGQNPSIDIDPSIIIASGDSVTIQTASQITLGQRANPNLPNHLDQGEFDTIHSPSIYTISDELFTTDLSFNSSTVNTFHAEAFSTYFVSSANSVTTTNGLDLGPGSSLRHFEVAVDGSAFLMRDINLPSVDVVIDAGSNGSILLDAGDIVQAGNLVLRASDFVLDGRLVAPSTRLTLTEPSIIGTGGVLTGDELGRVSGTLLTVESEGDLTVADLFIDTACCISTIPDLVLTTPGTVTVTGDVIGVRDQFFAGDDSFFLAPYSLSFGEVAGIRPAAVNVTGRLGVNPNGTLDPFSALAFYVDGDVSITSPYFAGETVLAANAMNVDITGTFTQRNTNSAAPSPLINGVGGTGAILGPVTLTNASGLLLYGTIAGLSDDQARTSVNALVPVTSQHLVNDCSLAATLCQLTLAPVAVDDSGTSVLGADFRANVLGNDTDPDPGDTLSVVGVDGIATNVGTLVAGSNGGTFTILANGDVVFDPGGDFDNLQAAASATTSITYTVSDLSGNTAMAQLTVLVLSPALPVPPEPPVEVSPVPDTVEVATEEISSSAFIEFTVMNQGLEDMAADSLPLTNRANTEEWE